MNSGILWLPDFIMFMFTFSFKTDFVIQLSAMNPMKNSEIVINIMLFLIWSCHKYCELSQYNEQIYPRWDIPPCTAAYFLLNISNLTLQVIGSCKTQFILPVIILQ